MIKVLTSSSALFLSSLIHAQAAEAIDFCPGDDLPYTFTVFEDVLLINRSNRRTFCQHIEGSSFECLDKWPASDTVSVYTVQSSFRDDGSLIFQVGKDNDPVTAERCE